MALRREGTQKNRPDTFGYMEKSVVWTGTCDSRAPPPGSRPTEACHAVFMKATWKKHGCTAIHGQGRAIQRGQLQATVALTAQGRNRMDELLAADVEYHHRLGRASNRSKYLAEKVESEANKRKLVPSQPDPKTTADQSKAGQNEMDQTMPDCEPSGSWWKFILNGPTPQ